MSLIDDLGTENGKDHVPQVHAGDTVEVHYLIKEGDKERIQLFVGTVIALQGRGIARAIIVRRIVQGEGVERIFPLHSPRVKDVVVSRRGNVRQARLYYLRDRVGKGTRVDELLGEKVRREREREDSSREGLGDDRAQSLVEANDAEPEAVKV
jgi:large subunit ribosomal protein L19